MSTRTGLETRFEDNAKLSEHDATAPGRVDDTDGWRLSRYDLILVLLPLPLLFGIGWASVTAAPMSAGASLGSVPTLAVLVYGLFVAGPTDPSGDDAR